jgi:hypothetical protein
MQTQRTIMICTCFLILLLLSYSVVYASSQCVPGKKATGHIIVSGDTHNIGHKAAPVEAGTIFTDELGRQYISTKTITPFAVSSKVLSSINQINDRNSFILYYDYLTYNYFFTMDSEVYIEDMRGYSCLNGKIAKPTHHTNSGLTFSHSPSDHRYYDGMCKLHKPIANIIRSTTIRVPVEAVEPGSYYNEVYLDHHFYLPEKLYGLRPFGMIAEPIRGGTDEVCG